MSLLDPNKEGDACVHHTLLGGKKLCVCARCRLQFDEKGNAIISKNSTLRRAPKEQRCHHMRAEKPKSKVYIAFEDYDYEGGQVKSVHKTRIGASAAIVLDRQKRKRDEVPAADGYHIEEYTLND